MRTYLDLAIIVLSITLIIIIVLAILGSALPAIRATRVSVRQSLAYE